MLADVLGIVDLRWLKTPALELRKEET